MHSNSGTRARKSASIALLRYAGPEWHLTLAIGFSMRAGCRRNRHKARCGDSDLSSGQRSSSRLPRWRWRRYGRQSYPFGMRPCLEIASRGRSALFSDSATRMRASPRGCQCVLLALPLSASLLHEGPDVGVPIASVLSDCKPKLNAHVLSTSEHTSN